MPQTIPIKTYVLITLVTLGVGVVYWLYKVVNLYNAHYKAHLQVEKEIGKANGGTKSCRAHVKNAGSLATAETSGVLAENTTYPSKKCSNSADP